MKSSASIFSHVSPTIGCVAAALLVAALATPAEAARHRHAKKAAAHAPISTPVSLEARHKVCLDFIQRHGKTCDPWQTPTCGYDIGFMRPLECVAP